MRVVCMVILNFLQIISIIAVDNTIFFVDVLPVANIGNYACTCAFTNACTYACVHARARARAHTHTYPHIRTQL